MDKFPILRKKEIDEGKIQQEALHLTSLMRNFFLLSNGIRKSNEFYLLCLHEFEEREYCLLIHFNGEKIRYLSPDERVTLLTFEKINLIMEGNSQKKIYKKEISKFKEGRWAQSTPGIYLKKLAKNEIWDYFKENISGIVLFNIEEISTLSKKFNIENFNSLRELSRKIEPEMLIISGSNISILNEILNLNIFHTKQFLKFYNKDLSDKFFTSQLIGILQTLYENLEKT